MVVCSAGVKLSRIGIAADESYIRGAKHRTMLAELNESYEGYTPDLFSEYDKKQGDAGTLGVILLNINPPLSFAQDSMLGLRVIVPFTNMKDFHLNWSVEELLAHYNDEQKTAPDDKALPTLKKRLKEIEN